MEDTFHALLAFRGYAAACATSLQQRGSLTSTNELSKSTQVAALMVFLSQNQGSLGDDRANKTVFFNRKEMMWYMVSLTKFPQINTQQHTT